mmetsp:Transcript_25273/g.47162  ORF Transcript_25273/g.47162 Transcript_25273/m.47162 type:complete len:208 (+) Transcript_25273:584-1207(+)
MVVYVRPSTRMPPPSCSGGKRRVRRDLTSRDSSWNQRSSRRCTCALQSGRCSACAWPCAQNCRIHSNSATSWAFIALSRSPAVSHRSPPSTPPAVMASARRPATPARVECESRSPTRKVAEKRAPSPVTTQCWCVSLKSPSMKYTSLSLIGCSSAGVWTSQATFKPMLHDWPPPFSFASASSSFSSPLSSPLLVRFAASVHPPAADN